MRERERKLSERWWVREVGVRGWSEREWSERGWDEWSERGR